MLGELALGILLGVIIILIIQGFNIFPFLFLWFSGLFCLAAGYWWSRKNGY